MNVLRGILIGVTIGAFADGYLVVASILMLILFLDVGSALFYNLMRIG